MRVMTDACIAWNYVHPINIITKRNDSECVRESEIVARRSVGRWHWLPIHLLPIFSVFPFPFQPTHPFARDQYIH